MRKRLTIGLLAGLMVMVGLGFTAMRSQAADTDPTAASPLDTAPSGLDQLDKLFTVPAVFSDGVSNAASIQNVTNSASPNTQAVQINNSKRQLGGVWSSDTNQFDLNQDTTLSMWLYFGASKSKAGDGLAFVLQNDPNGTTAASSYTKQNIIGETMGVWGVDDDKSRTDSAEIAATAIQNSWALEFDTYSNTSSSYSDAGSGSAFDVGIKGQHMATGYPGLADTYINKKVTQLLWADRYLFTQAHTNPVPSLSLTDAAWHHLVLKWDASTKTMTYTLNDVNPDGSTNANPITRSEVIDTSQFHSTNGLVHWGFVGTNGSNAGNSLVVFESITHLNIDVDADMKVFDKTKNREVTTGSKVKANDELEYTYNLNYKDGQIDWERITANIDLPKAVTFSEATIKYADGATQFLKAPEAGAESVTYDIGKNLHAGNAKATITLTGKADSVKVNTQTTATDAVFANEKYEAKTTAPDYLITVAQPLTLYIPTQDYTIDNGSDLKISGLVLAEDSEQLTNSWITVYSELNGTDLDPFRLSDDDESGVLRIALKSNQLHVGDNTLDVYVMDDDENTSDTVHIKIHVTSGSLGFKTVASASKFSAITLDGKAQTSQREDDWELVVADDRGKGSSWQLQASAGDFTTEAGRKLPGQVVYKNGDQSTVINGSGTVIDSHESTSDADEYDVTKNWTKDTGLLFETNAAATPGAYSGKITWTLSNAPS
ncbi:cell surface protein [Lactiplantibacillus sp. WILCCON 0030]|uniref:Cell surface protein n=1 Tax=Lactiplantibacillus brownii TaxID=3069269 RepID=A0ABU1ACE3_9LACO|nr:cell surface protein [Lactiplantibacillus brownii]MDQ7938614.1 cell surface protein [Lactiplantibacillus brownii]